MALEIIEQVPDLDAIVVPTGGGGLLAGIAVAAKSMNPNIKIIVSLWLFNLKIHFFFNNQWK
jgi:threonine dehydratase